MVGGGCGTVMADWDILERGRGMRGGRVGRAGARARPEHGDRRRGNVNQSPDIQEGILQPRIAMCQP